MTSSDDQSHDDDETLVVVAYFSGFRGSTAAVAEAVAEGARALPGTRVVVFSVTDVDDHWADIHAADAIIFGSPTYVGSVAADFKHFIERLAGQVWVERRLLNKVGSAFTVGSGRSGDKLNCLVDMVVFGAQMGMIWVPVRVTGGNYSSTGSENDLNRMGGYLGVMAQANIDEEPPEAPPSSDMATARMHGEHVAVIAARLRVGKRAVDAPYEEFEAWDGEVPRNLLQSGLHAL